MQLKGWEERKEKEKKKEKKKELLGTTVLVKQISICCSTESYILTCSRLDDHSSRFAAKRTLRQIPAPTVHHPGQDHTASTPPRDHTPAVHHPWATQTQNQLTRSLQADQNLCKFRCSRRTYICKLTRTCANFDVLVQK